MLLEQMSMSQEKFRMSPKTPIVLNLIGDYLSVFLPDRCIHGAIIWFIGDLIDRRREGRHLRTFCGFHAH
jgi:hypothetical protein